jgi:pyruvate kinase
VLTRLVELGVSLFRLNLSHTKVSKLKEILEYIQSRTNVPVCLDTEGAQVRTGDFAEGKITVLENSTLRVPFHRVSGDSGNLNLYPEEIARQLIVGDLLKIDAEVLAQVVAIENDCVVLWVLNGGEIGQNKAVSLLERDLTMPAVTEKDKQALRIGNEMGIRHVALSFANRARDVEEVRALASKDAIVVSKIECLSGLRNLPEIAAQSDALLIDRGDLSRQVSIEKIPAVQKDIIHYAKGVGRKIYVATNLLESMVTSANPTRAEVNDIYNTLMDGADGLVLAAECAIGAFPVAAANMVKKIILEYENKQNSWHQVHYSSTAVNSLVEPYGGALVQRAATIIDRRGRRNCPTLQVKTTDLMDCVQIASGAYSPLTGFMGSKELDSVLNDNRLQNGLAWTVPIVLQVDEKSLSGISAGDRVALTDNNGKIHATLDVTEIYDFDFEKLAQKWFGTSSLKHPGVKKLAEGGDRLVAGAVTLVEHFATPYRQFELSPSQSRLIFAQKGWSKVVGFYANSVPHRAHEYMQLKALEAVHADGIFISLLVGPKRRGDFQTGAILKSYQHLLQTKIYPSGKFALGVSQLYPRYCGPREAVFMGICARNMGCSHLVIGEDYLHSDGFYEPSQIREAFELIGDIGCTPVFFEAAAKDPATNEITPVRDQVIKSALAKKESLPDWMIRDTLQQVLLQEISENRQVFYL